MRASESELVFVLLLPDWVKKWREFYKSTGREVDAKSITFRYSHQNHSNTNLKIIKTLF